MDLSSTVIIWRDVTLYGHRDLGRFTFSELDGWDSLPDARQDSNARPQAHGRFDAEVFSDERHVMASGLCQTAAERDAMLAELQASFNFSARTPLPLRITHAGRTLTADARLLRFKPTPVNWGAGFFGWAAEWVCADPLRYGDPVSVPTTFPTLRGGLEYDLYTDGTTDTGYLEYGAASDTGRIMVTNTGSAEASVLFQVAGLVDSLGFDIAQIDTDKRLRFVGPVATGSTLVMDGGTGNVLIDGSGERGGQLIIRDWPLIGPHSSVELAFIPLGSTTNARLTAVVRPGSW